ncbi:histone acetyltransferase hac1 [Quercus suber]|uniref:Histone acetyltransferase hac1 n=1 Tax=Quercus suber TaxID=58331 RepID=A0AAW0IRU6_QUESU
MGLGEKKKKEEAMNLQAHISGPAAATAAQNQAAQNLGAGGGGGGGGGGVRGFFAADNEMPRARALMQDKIYTILLQRLQQQPLDENTRRKFKDIVKRLEEGLLRSAHSKEDYMNLETLESRLHQLIKRSHMNPRTQYPQLVNSSSPVRTMIPTPGMSHTVSCQFFH